MATSPMSTRAVTVSGSTEQILTQLPGLASALSKQLGIASPHIPAKVGVTPAELSLLGAAAWENRNTVSNASREQVAALAKRCFELKWIERVRDSRALLVTPAGRRGLMEAFACQWPITAP